MRMSSEPPNFRDLLTLPRYEAAKVAKEMLTPGKLVMPFESFMMQETKSLTPGETMQHYPHTQTRPIYYDISHTMQLMVISPPTLFESEITDDYFLQRSEDWAQLKLGFVSIILLFGDQLFETPVWIKKDVEPTKTLSTRFSDEFLLQNPALIFYPYLQPARPGTLSKD